MQSLHPQDYRGPHAKTSGSNGRGRCQHVKKFSKEYCTAHSRRYSVLKWTEAASNNCYNYEAPMILSSDGLGYLTVICILKTERHNVCLYNIFYLLLLNKESHYRDFVQEFCFTLCLEQRMFINCTWVRLVT
jgi:hypothetical protein